MSQACSHRCRAKHTNPHPHRSALDAVVGNTLVLDLIHERLAVKTQQNRFAKTSAVLLYSSLSFSASRCPLNLFSTVCMTIRLSQTEFLPLAQASDQQDAQVRSSAGVQSYRQRRLINELFDRCFQFCNDSLLSVLTENYFLLQCSLENCRNIGFTFRPPFRIS